MKNVMICALLILVIAVFSLGACKKSGDDNSSLLLLLASGGGKFIAVGGTTTTAGLRYSSTDGINWTAITPSGHAYYGITFGYGRYLAVGDSGARTFSTDGVTWDADLTGDPEAYYGAACGLNRIIAAGGNGQIKQYDTASGWLGTSSTAGDVYMDIAFGETNFLIVGYNAGGGILYPSSCFGSACWDSYFFYAANKKSTTYDLAAVTYGNGKYVAVGESGWIYVVDKTGTASSSVKAAAFGLNGVAYGNGKFVAVGLNGVGAYSTDDGVTWHSCTFSSGSAENLSAITYGNGRFVAVGNHGRTVASTDGITFPDSMEGNVGEALSLMSGIVFR
jgi:hypothetical protein